MRGGAEGTVRGAAAQPPFVVDLLSRWFITDRTGGPPDEDKLMTLADLRRELAGLDFVHAVELEREVVEGRLHHGLGAVVQVVAVRP